MLSTSLNSIGSSLWITRGIKLFITTDTEVKQNSQSVTVKDFWWLKFADISSSLLMLLFQAAYLSTW